MTKDETIQAAWILLREKEKRIAELEKAVKRLLDEDNHDLPHTDMHCPTEPCRFCFAEKVLAKVAALTTPQREEP